MVELGDGAHLVKSSESEMTGCSFVGNWRYGVYFDEVGSNNQPVRESTWSGNGRAEEEDGGGNAGTGASDEEVVGGDQVASPTNANPMPKDTDWGEPGDL
jgi:hypothetical protein